MRVLKTKKNKLIAIILAITTLSSLFAIMGNAYQMGGPSYVTESSVNKYRVYFWNEDPSNITNSTPYKLHTDLEFMNSDYTFAFICASIKRYNSITHKWIDNELVNLELHLDEQEVYHRATPNGYFSVSAICNSNNTSVTDDYIDNLGRDFDNGVIARAHVLVGTLNGSGNQFYTVYSGGGIDYSQSPTFSYNSNSDYLKHFSRVWS